MVLMVLSRSQNSTHYWLVRKINHSGTTDAEDGGSSVCVTVEGLAAP